MAFLLLGCAQKQNYDLSNIYPRELVEIIERLRGEGKMTLADDLERNIERELQQTKWLDKGYVVVGQLVLVSKDVPGGKPQVQTDILDEGYFAAAVGDLSRPLGFRAHGYEPLDFSLLRLDRRPISYVGQVEMRHLTSKDVASLKGQVLLQGSPVRTWVGLRLGGAQANRLSNATSGGQVPVVTQRTDEQGRFALDGFSPGDYFLSIQGPTFVQLEKKITFSRGQVLDLGVLDLRPRPPVFRIPDLPASRGLTPDRVMDTGFSASDQAYNLTSADATKMAYDKAVDWQKDAKLWSVKHYGYDVYWNSSSRWRILFASGRTNKLFMVSLEDKRILLAKEVASTRRGGFKHDFPASSPPVSLANALGTCIGAMGISVADVRNLTSEYYVDELEGPFPNLPLWTSRVAGVDGQKKHCIIDARTGKVLKFADLNPSFWQRLFLRRRPSMSKKR